MTQLPTLGPHGMLGVDFGNVMDRGREEYYISAPFKLPENTCVRKVSWEVELSPNTWVRMQLRFAATRDSLELSPWLGEHGEKSWVENHECIDSRAYAGEWCQYRLALGSSGGGTPRISEVNVFYE